MCQQQFEAEVLSELQSQQSQYAAECELEDAEQEMEPNKRSGYFEMMCEMADEHRKWLRENGI